MTTYSVQGYWFEREGPLGAVSAWGQAQADFVMDEGVESFTYRYLDGWAGSGVPPAVLDPSVRNLRVDGRNITDGISNTIFAAEVAAEDGSVRLINAGLAVGPQDNGRSYVFALDGPLPAIDTLDGASRFVSDTLDGPRQPARGDFAVGAPILLDGTSNTILISESDLFEGRAGPDVFWGGAGNDTIFGLGGDDVLIGGTGNNVIDGGGGQDFIGGGPGNDTLRGGDGNDTIHAGAGDDNIGGGSGDDLIYAVAGRNIIWGGLGNDTVQGGSGADTIYGGGNGTNRLFGNAGDDLIFAGGGGDYIGGGAGNDTIRGGDGADTIWGGLGNDNIGGGAGNDILHGSAGNNTIWGGAGNDTVHAGTGKDLLYGGPGADVFVFASSAHIGIGAGRDMIADFSPSVDRIDLSALATWFNGTGGLTGGGQASFYLFAPGGLLIGDQTGDGAADWVLELTGAPAVTAADFIL